MATFDRDDPKYLICCCGAHVTKLARVFVLISLVIAIHNLRERSFLEVIGFAITILGTFSIFMEARNPIILYIILSITHGFVTIIDGLHAVKSISDTGTAISFALFYYLAAAIIEVFFLLTFWTLAEFIQDRVFSINFYPGSQVHVFLGFFSEEIRRKNVFDATSSEANGGSVRKMRLSIAISTLKNPETQSSKN
ncbi:hypothetical protein PRIPAC_87055 [Pristionchus pacificus]|uniref:Uncharacterized protein n=1 Tax=Pristionchus pacificus TaxID=54126 RepID=A0A2A6BVB5_PRIPA|nr:hypothetical protein PRIPAC_87055 [Pristionchus pacificus]|eukprot:PDM69807.1 hypothetical protein PRIPAC_44903 [Pristionchus pacificus]